MSCFIVELDTSWRVLFPIRLLLLVSYSVTFASSRIDMHPGKRAVAIMFIVYHMITSTVLCQAPRFIPLTLGSIAER